QLWNSPPDIATTPVKPPTARGVLLFVYVPLPQLAMVVKPPSPDRAVGLERQAVEASAAAYRHHSRQDGHRRVAACVRSIAQLAKLTPSQVQTVPSLFSARLCKSWLPTIATTPVRPLTCTGVMLEV